MTRRDSASTAGTAVATRPAWADYPRDVKVTRVVSFELASRRPKYIGKNSHKDDHGQTSTDRVVRLYTSTGVEAFGPCWSGANECAQLLGKNPFDYLDAHSACFRSPLDRNTAPLWDLAGRVLKKPVYELLGAAGPARVRVYDGSVYLSELVPQYAGRGLDRFKDEIDAGMAMGHRVFKVKIGRGYRWMLAEEGYARDLEVLKVIRRHGGRDIGISVDANDGYDLERTERLLADLPDYGFAWLEEMFPDSVEDCLKLKGYMTARGCKTLISDGETLSHPAEMKSWVEAKAVDLLQGDMNLFGFEDVLAEAAMAGVAGAMVAPHNWGSLLGFYLQLHVGRAITNFYGAEHDPLACPAVIADGYAIKDGYCSVPDSPGLGLRLDEDKLPEYARPHFDLRL